MSISVSGSTEKLPEDPRVSLLDYLPEHLQFHGTKKGVRPGRVRCLHGAGRRAPDPVVSRAGRSVRGTFGHHDRSAAYDPDQAIISAHPVWPTLP